MSTEFNLTRLGYFIKRQLYMNFSSMWIAIAAIVGVLLAISGLTAYFQPLAVYNLIPLYLVVLFIGGYIFTSSVFNEMHAPQKGYAFLTLPVSTAERLIGAWLIVAPVYLIVSMASIFILAFASAAVAGQPANLPNLTDAGFLKVIGTFLTVQTFFFLGATAFRGNNFLKTLLALFLVVLVVGAYTGGLTYLLLGHSSNRLVPDGSAFKENAKFIVEDVVPFLFGFVLGPFLLVVSYFKLKERQV